MVPFWFLPFAIGCGNTFILKPSEQVPLTQQIAFQELDALGLPPGVVNLVNGGREVVEGILEHPGIDAVSFVGSAPVARIVYERCGATGKRVQALGGAKNHMVVMPDAVVDETVKGIIGSGFGAAGQRCMAGSVVVTVGDAYDRVVPPLVEATKALQVGDGLEEANDVGPTIVEVDPDDEIVGVEVFGPLLSVVRVDSLDEAIEVVNRSEFGNGTSIFTESGAAVRKYKHDVEAGMVGVNIGVAAPVAFFPFSGWKASFLGDLHAHGTDAVDFFTRKKTITSRYFSETESGRYFVES
jgi:malonate-semialdehyde dehydrogenase (acetylating)/methylmalonate-semialdehyde dehydrogenase